MRYEFYIEQTMQLVELKSIMIIGQNPELINALNRNLISLFEKTPL